MFERLQFNCHPNAKKDEKLQKFITETLKEHKEERRNMMTKKLLKIFNVGLFIVSVVCLIYLMFLKTNEPNMTVAIFFVTYYKEIIISFVAFIISSLSMRRE